MDCCHQNQDEDNKTVGQNEQGVSYTCPMHPEVVSDKPGRCPECGMNLLPTKISAKDHANHASHGDQSKVGELNKHAGHKTTDFLAKFWLSLILTIPVLAYSELPERLFGAKAPVFPGSNYLQFVLGSIVFFYAGWIFLLGAYRELKARLPGMMTLIAIATSAAYLFSVYETFLGSNHTLFWELTTLVTIMLLGHWVEMRAVQGAQGALKELSKLLPDKAEKINQKSNLKNQNDGKFLDLETEMVALEELQVGDWVMVRPGGKIPADGVVIQGSSEVNEAMMTGESKPVLKEFDAKVVAGAINGDGSLIIKVTEIGTKTFLSGVMRLVAEAQASKSRLQLLSDRAAYYLTLVAVTAGFTTLVVWLSVGAGPTIAVERLVAVLVIACPHALGLAVPLVASISTTMAARNGLLVRNRLALEAARNVDVVLFDKTGTLTKGEYGMDQIIQISKTINKDEVLRLAAAVDSRSEHFIARALVAEAADQKIKLPEVTEFTRVPGKGVKGKVDGKIVLVGGQTILEDAGLTIPKNIEESTLRLTKEGKTVVFVIADKEVVGAIALADIIRAEAKEAVKALQNLGVRVAMVTGDSEETADWVAGELGIDQVFARVQPDQKASIVQYLQTGKIGNSEIVKLFENWKLKIVNSTVRQAVAMVGDGINDAPALTQADLGIAIGAGTNVAIESAGIILVKSDPRDIVKIIRLSRLTYSKMISNLFWATGYNVVALPLAAGVLAGSGIILEPAVSALLMSLSTVIVSINAVLLRRNRL